MSNLQQHYQLTARIHELLPKINQKYGLEIKVESDYTWYNFQKGETPDWQIAIYIGDELRSVFAIQTPQIRQILVGLKGVLGIHKVQFLLEEWCNYKIWSDDVDTLFNREPETVLTELVGILENLLK